jgi:hypothetical protein
MEQVTRATGIDSGLEPEVLWARRAFPKAQEWLAGEPLRSIGLVDIGWHYTDAHPETGAFAVVRRGGPFDIAGETPLLGEVVILGGHDPVYVYCVNSAAVVADLSVTRRVFLALGLLARDRVRVEVEVRA